MSNNFEMPVSLLCLIGLPGSGKTTLAGLLTSHFAETGVKSVCVEYDSFIQDCTQGVWKGQRRKLLYEIKRVAVGLNGNRNSVVILDDNFYYRSMRYEVFRIAKELNMGFGQVFLNVPFELCCSRNMSRAKPIASEVMSRMRSLIEHPEPSRCPWERHSYVADASPNLRIILQLVAATWAQPYSPEPENQNLPQENSSTHHADLALRQIVKKIILSTPRDRRSQITSSLTVKKKCVLEDVKMNNIILPVLGANADAVAEYITILEPYFSDLFQS